jgi:hypothetical protein
LQIPLLDVYGPHGISFQNLTGGYGAIFSDSFDEAVCVYFKSAGGETVETITTTITELQKFGPGFIPPVPDYRLVIEREKLQLVDFQIVDSGATMHLVPVYITNVMMVPVPPPATYVPVINLANFLRYSTSMTSFKKWTSLFSCFQPVRLSTLIQRWDPLLPLIWSVHWQFCQGLTDFDLLRSNLSESSCFRLSSLHGVRGLC